MIFTTITQNTYDGGGSLNISCNRGDTAEFQVQTERNGVPIDLTGATIVMSVRRNVASPVLFTKSVGSGITVASPTSGAMAIHLLSADTSVLPNESFAYIYDIRVTTSGGDTWCVAEGTFQLNPVVGI